MCASLYVSCSYDFAIFLAQPLESKLERHFPLHYFQAALKLHSLGGRFVGSCQYAKSSPSGANWEGERGGVLSGFASICGGCSSNSEAHELD